jgi:chloride channel protein, CIC family
MPAPDTPHELSHDQADALLRSRRFLVLLVIVSIVGVVVSLAAWCFLEGVFQIQEELYTHLPHALGYQSGPPKWWPLPILAIGALLVALAITRLPGNGGHVPAEGLAAGGAVSPKALPGILLAGAATIGSGLVLGPEAPLIALGSGLAAAMIGLARRDTPPQTMLLVAAAGSFSAVSFIFDSPLIAAALLIEATAIGGPRLRLVLVPGLLAAGIGSLVSIGMGHFTGLSSKDYSLGALPLSAAPRPTIAAFGWTMALAIAVAAIICLALRGGMFTHRFISRRRLLALWPAIGLVIAALAIAFSQITGRGFEEVLFSGQDQLPGLVSQAGTWSVGALVWLIVFKGIGYSLSLGSLRGGPTFPAIFLGAAAGLIASHLPGFGIQAGVAVGLGAGVVAVLRLPLSAVVLATVLTAPAGSNVEPLIIVGVIVAYIVSLVLSRPPAPKAATAARPAAAPEPASSSTQ